MLDCFLFLKNNLKKNINFFYLNKKLIFFYLNKDFLLVYIYILTHHLNLQFKQLLDIFVVDFPEKKNRFSLSYVLLSLTYNFRCFVKVFTNEKNPVLSVSCIFNSANWLEREAWDLFGVIFLNNSDLRRILTDYGFDGYPLRKDFPLTGYIELRFDDKIKLVISESLEITQELRYFNFKSPWELKK